MLVPKTLPLLTSTLREAPVIRVNGYDYFVHPITDGVPEIGAPLLEEVVAALKALIPEGVDRFLSPEAMGIPLGSALTLATRRPFTIARKRPYGLPGEVRAEQQTGYSTGTFYVNGVRKGERVVLVDDVASTGGTIRALVQATRSAGALPVKVLVVINKGLDLVRLGAELNVPIEALVTLRIRDGRVVLED